jgi:hypothetical protein
METIGHQIVSLSGLIIFFKNKMGELSMFILGWK